jgi:methionyl-tRNA formyltransferase
LGKNKIAVLSLNIDRETHHKTVMRSALLTTGFGPIVKRTYEALLKHTDLRAVVFSIKISSRWKKLKAYGLWYMLQYIITRMVYFLTGNAKILHQLQDQIATINWKSRKDHEFIKEWLNNFKIDVIFVCDFPHILPKEFFSKFRYCINIHPSLLPNYRGPKPIIWGLLDRISEFGITLQLIDEGIDTGDIICQKVIGKPILPFSVLVEMKLAQILPELIKHTFNQIESGKLHTQKQEGGFYLSFPTLANRRIKRQE